MPSPTAIVKIVNVARNLVAIAVLSTDAAFAQERAR